MAKVLRHEDTICALASGIGQSGIAVIRVSGAHAFFFVRQLCQFLPGEPQSHRAYHGFLKSTDDLEIDEVLVTYFSQGKSYTGDETCEISCHGNPVIAGQVLSQLVSLGCRPAERGEFTYRAFMNNRIDLIQAESVLTLIEGTSKKATQASLRQLKGNLSHLFSDLEEKIVWILSQLEAEIDFSTEGITAISSEEATGHINKLIATCEGLILSYRNGRLLTDGITVAIIGRPNAGKSSLLNRLSHTDRAIVSPTPGTTRDTVEATHRIGGLSVTLIDTAGLRVTDSEVESLGIQRSYRAMESADLVLHVVDASSEDASWSDAILPDRTMIVLSKIDLLSECRREAIRNRFSHRKFIEVSAVTGEGLPEVDSFLESYFSLSTSDLTPVIINARHEQQLGAVLRLLHQAQESLSSNVSIEFACLDLREALNGVGQLLGRGLSEDVIDRIFKDFCIGK